MASGGTQVVEKPVFRAPPAAPALEEAATLDLSIDTEDQAKKKRKAQSMGAKSLQIPTSNSTANSTVGKI